MTSISKCIWILYQCGDIICTGLAGHKHNLQGVNPPTSVEYNFELLLALESIGVKYCKVVIGFSS